MQNYKQYPWYFEPNGVLEAWGVAKGAGVVVTLLDGCVDFSVPALRGRRANNSENCSVKNDDSAYSIHGTAMAGLISGARIALSIGGTQYWLAGIAPNAMIHNIEGTKVESMQRAYEGREVPTTSYDVPVLKTAKDRNRLNVLLINLSGGQKNKIGYDVVAEWKSIIDTICKAKDNTLVVAAVGNDGIELTKTNIGTYGVLPASFWQLKACKDFDPVIRVGATSKYNVGEQPDLYRSFRGGSNYGKNYTDILAPGHSIAVLLPTLTNTEARLGGGTSEATAIVTGTIALLNSCRPYATSHELKQVLFSQAKSYKDLEDKVTEGRVLNIYQAVSAFCFNYEQEDFDVLDRDNHNIVGDASSMHDEL